MPVGFLIGVSVHAALVGLTLWAPRRPRPLAGAAYRVAAAYNEVPFVFIYLVGVSSIGPLMDLGAASAGAWVALASAGLVVVGLSTIARWGERERPLVMDALDDGLGAGWRSATRSDWLDLVRERAPIGRILFMPFVTRPRVVRAVRNVRYGDAGRQNRLDVYHHRSRRAGAPMLIHFHGGGFRGGRKSVESRALLFQLASHGWVTISADYRLRPDASFHDHLVDAKRVIAWAREHAQEHGADPSTIFVAGGSAGGTLASLAGLTQGDPRYQPGFEDADTSVSGVVSLYGWYGGYYELGDADSEFGVVGHDASGAPPFLIAHGRRDSLATIETARRFDDTCVARRAIPWCSPSSHTVSMRSTCSTRSASPPSSTASRRSPPGPDRAQHRRTPTWHDDPMSTNRGALTPATAKFRHSPFFDATIAAGVVSMVPYNRMLMPTSYGDPVAEYRRLTQGVAMWDVACERQIQVAGPDAARLAQILTPRDVSKCSEGQGRYVAVCDHRGTILNDPVLMRIDDDRFWFSIADSDVGMWAAAIAAERRLDAAVSEPDVSPLAVQGPMAEDVVASMLGDWVRGLRYFAFAPAEVDGIPLTVARSGWSKQGGFELYLMDGARGVELWNLVAEAGAPWDIGPGCPNASERIESGLLSWGGDTDSRTNPFEVRMGRYVDLDLPSSVIGIDALRRIAAEGPERHQVGIVLDGTDPAPTHDRWYDVLHDGVRVGDMTNGTWSYRLERNIGFGLLGVGCTPGDRVTVERAGSPVDGTVVDLPFAG